MKELSTSLLREKFVIYDPDANPENPKAQIVALSNRMVIELVTDNNDRRETFVVRSHNMHSCVRMAARLMQSFQSGGPLLNRHNPFDWDAAWDAVVNDYERSFNEQRWICIYNQGRIVFKYGDHHPLLDVIEKCDANNKGDYDAAIPMAENAIKQTGKVVKLDYDPNVALNVFLERKQGRCGIILRSPTRTTTFNFSAQAKGEKTLNFVQVLSTCAAFLEGIQLCFLIGMNEEKIKRGLIVRHSREEKMTREARLRMGRLNAEIANLESTFDTHYRPERPEFHLILAEAEKLAQKILDSSKSKT